MNVFSVLIEFKRFFKFRSQFFERKFVADGKKKIQAQGFTGDFFKPLNIE